MLANIRPSALCVGAFFGYAVPIAVSLWVINSLFGAAHARDALSASGYFWMLIFLHVGGPLLGGILAARMGKTQPLMHGLFTALVGWLVASAAGNGLLVGIVYVLASVTGAAIWKSQNR